MGQVVCRTQYSGSYGCFFEEWSVLKDLTAKANPYSWSPLIFSAFGVLCLLLLWIISFCIRYRDFTRSFVICQLIPYTITYICKLAYNIFEQISFRSESPSTFYSSSKPFWPEPVSGIYNIAIATTGLNLPLGTLVFLIMSIYAAHARKMVTQGIGWGLYILVLITSIVIGCGNLFFLTDVQSIYAVIYNWLARASILACSFCLIIILFAICFCTKPHIGQSSDPPVANAKSRMAWTIPFVLLAFQPLCYGLMVTDIFYALRSYDTSNDVLFVFMDTFILADMLDPIILTISVIFFLPAYRSTLFCSQGYMRKKGIAASKNMEVGKGVIRVALPPPANTIANVPAPVPITQTQGSYDANLVAMLTTPTAMHAQPNLTLSQPVQNCSCQTPAFISTAPTYQLLQPTFTPVHAANCSHQHGTLVRFASQPNLVAPATLQPTVNLPQMNTIYVG